MSAIGVTLLVASILTVAPSAGASPKSNRVQYPGAVPAVVGRTVAASAVAATATEEGELYLNVRHPAAEVALAGAVSNPASPSYGKYVTPAAWINEFSPTKATLASAEAYLTGSGFHVYSVPASRLYIVFRGPASLFGSVFQTSIRTYRSGNHSVTAPATAPSLPASIASGVSGIRLGSSSAAVPAAVKVVSAKKPANAAAPVLTCSDYWAQHSYKLPKAYGRTTFPTNNCGYVPQQLRSSAGLNSSENGAGQTIGIVDAYASPTIVNDANTYSRLVGTTPLSGFTQHKPGNFEDEALCQYPSGWQAEETLDVESAHAVAPKASIVYSGGFDCEGGLDIALSRILDGHLATIVSNSYSDAPDVLLPADYIQNQENQHLQAAAEGIGLYYSTGDDGDNALSFGVAGPNYPASSPWVTSVGGTSLAIGKSGKYLFETGWGDYRDQVVNGAYVDALPGAFYAGAGGGRSTVFAEPSYQRGVVPASLAVDSSGNAMRVIPDISDVADPYTGFLIGIRPIIDDTTLQTGPFETETFGGTSLASPVVAAKMAILQQKLGRTIGFSNPLTYAIRRGDANAFHDVNPAGKIGLARLSPSAGLLLVTLNEDTSLLTTKGYDEVTGIGSLDIPRLLKYLS